MDSLFLERMLLLLNQGNFTTTYKYALLLALIDVNIEGAGQGGPVTSVTTRQLAERVIVLYWPHTRPYARRRARLRRVASASGRALTPALTLRRAGQGQRLSEAGWALLQSSTVRDKKRRQAEIVTLIAKTRAALHKRDASADRRPHLAQRADPRRYERLVRDVEWVLAEKPIPRLQIIGSSHDPFLYRLDWTIEQSKGRLIEPGLPKLTEGALRAGTLSNTLQLMPGVHERLVSLAAVLRPLIHRHWSDMVARLNSLPERRLEEFLFGASRESLAPVREPLWRLQGGRCFYCGGRVSLAQAEVDHVLPWSRFAEDGLENLVVADASCNSHKSDLLPGREAILPWLSRPAAALAAIAEATGWPLARDRVRSTCAVVYRQLSPGVPVWRGGGVVGRLTEDEQRGVLGALGAKGGGA
ncbi:MAG: HNH endonuclease [Deltaproteobacteria bacterium]|nr:HNH endonuclease [Deltaproteobacteria bacterium]